LLFIALLHKNCLFFAFSFFLLLFIAFYCFFIAYSCIVILKRKAKKKSESKKEKKKKKRKVESTSIEMLVEEPKAKKPKIAMGIPVGILHWFRSDNFKLEEVSKQKKKKERERERGN